MTLGRLWGKYSARRAVPAQVRHLRRRYPEIWADGQATGRMRCERKFLGEASTPMPPTLEGRIMRGQVEAEDAVQAMYLRMTLQEDVPDDLVDRDALEAFHWGFIQGWDEYIAADPSRVPLPPMKRDD